MLFNSLAKDVLSIVVYYSGLIYILRFLGRNYAKILLYHSVSESENKFIKGTNMWISYVVFEKHMNYILKHYHVISLQELVKFLQQGKIPPQSMVITFDDGFSDNFSFAYPYLRRHKIQTTIFLATDCIEKKKTIWIQELNYLINTVGVQKVIRSIHAMNEKYEIDQLIIETNSKRTIRKQVEDYLAYDVNKEERKKILGSLFREFNIRTKKVFSENQIFLTASQIRRMKKKGIYFGNHGASHTPFSAMSLDEQWREIVHSKKVIEENLGEDFVPFSYPFGQTKDFTLNTQRLVKEAGHSCILTAMPTLNHAGTSPFELGRIVVDNGPVYKLAFELEKGVLKHLLLNKKHELRGAMNG